MIKLRRATMKDFDFFYNLKCEPNSIKWSGFHNKPDAESFLQFYQKIIMEKQEGSCQREILIARNGDYDIGYIGIDMIDEESFDMPIGISEKHLGKGYSTQMLLLGLEEGRKRGYKYMKGSIREDNIASKSAYKKCGATFTGESHEVYVADKNKFVKMYDIIIEL